MIKLEDRLVEVEECSILLNSAAIASIYCILCRGRLKRKKKQCSHTQTKRSSSLLIMEGEVEIFWSNAQHREVACHSLLAQPISVPILGTIG